MLCVLMQNKVYCMFISHRAVFSFRSGESDCYLLIHTIAAFMGKCPELSLAVMNGRLITPGISHALIIAMLYPGQLPLFISVIIREC